MKGDLSDVRMWNMANRQPPLLVKLPKRELKNARMSILHKVDLGTDTYFLLNTVPR